MKAQTLFTASHALSVTGSLLSVELKSNTLTDAMIAEFGIYKTACAIQALYDADHLTESEALAMLDSVNNHMLYEFARYGDCYGNEQFKPITLH